MYIQSTRRYPRDYYSSVIFLLLKKDHIAKGVDQKNPPIAPIATTVAKVIGSVFGIPKRGPNKGIIDVMHPTGIRILKFTSGHLARFDIWLTMNAESSANENQPPHNTAKDPGSNSGRMNTIRINIASIAPVAAPEKMMFFQFTNNPIILDLYMPRANVTILSNVLRILTACSGAMLTVGIMMPPSTRLFSNVFHRYTD